MDFKKHRFVIYIKPNGFSLVREDDLKIWAVEFDDKIISNQEIIDPKAYKSKIDQFIKDLKKAKVVPGSLTYLLSSEMVYIKALENVTDSENVKTQINQFFDALPFDNTLIIANKVETNKGLKAYGANKSLYCSLVESLKKFGFSLDWVLPQFLYFSVDPKFDKKLFETIYIDTKLNNHADINCNKTNDHLFDVGSNSNLFSAINLVNLQQYPLQFIYDSLSQNSDHKYFFKTLIITNILIVVAVAALLSYWSFFSIDSSSTVRPVTTYNYEFDLTSNTSDAFGDNNLPELAVYYVQKSPVITDLLAELTSSNKYVISENLISDTAPFKDNQLVVSKDVPSEISTNLSNIISQYIESYEIIPSVLDLTSGTSPAMSLYIIR